MARKPRHRIDYQAPLIHNHVESPEQQDHGAVTVETAVIMPALVFLLAMLLATAAAGMAGVRYEEAARASARAAARGESSQIVHQQAREMAGENASVTVTPGPDRVSVTVTGPAPGILGQLTSWQLSADATAVTEGAQNAQP